MSKPAWEYLTMNLPEIRRTVLPNTGRPIGEPGLALIVYLSGQTNRKGEFFMTQKTMQEETDIASLRQVEKLLAGFKELTWITPTGEMVQYNERGRPTPVYVLTLFPQYARQFARTLQKNELSPSGGTVEKLSKPNIEKTLPKNNWIEPEPQPQPEPKLQLVAQGNGERGEEYKYVLGKCVEWERANYQGVAGAGLLYTWRKEYAPLVVRALQERPTDDLVLWCVEMRMPYRTGYQHKPNQPAPLAHLEHVSERHTEPEPEPEPMRGVPDCPTCSGRGWHPEWDEDAKPRKYRGVIDCTCVEKPPTVEQCPPEFDRINQLEINLLNKRDLGSVMNGMFKPIPKEPEPF